MTTKGAFRSHQLQYGDDLTHLDTSRVNVPSEVSPVEEITVPEEEVIPEEFKMFIGRGRLTFPELP